MRILRPIWHLFLGLLAIGFTIAIIRGLWDGSIWESRRAFADVCCMLPLAAVGGIFLLSLSFRQFRGKDLDIGGSD